MCWEVDNNKVIILLLDIWIVPEVCGISPQPCSECTLTGISQDRAILLGGIGRNWECVHNLEMIKILDMSSPVWVNL